MELYKKYRPSHPKDVVGQKEVMASLKSFGKDGLPHFILATGPSGTGKTTVFRILRTLLKCEGTDYAEINASKERGIHAVRDISRVVGIAPLSKCRIWMIDECHALTPDAQNAFLKILEDTPDHAYFFFATTDPQKLKKTIITRATEFKFKEISKPDLAKLVVKVATDEGKSLDQEVVKKIAEVSDGSARKALVILNAIIGLSDKDEQLAAVEVNDVKAEAISIARALTKSSTSWKEMAAILKGITDDPESIRHMVLSYMRSIMISGRGDVGRAAFVIDEFKTPFYDSKAAGLALACYNIVEDSGS